jgi:hypothetical protein
MLGITARRPGVAGAMVGALLCVAAIALPSTAGAAVPPSSSGSALTGAVARAELSGETLFKYHPATDSWTQVSIPDRPIGLLAPELSDLVGMLRGRLKAKAFAPGAPLPYTPVRHGRRSIVLRNGPSGTTRCTA